MSNIQLFDFQGHDVRVTDQEGNTWFVRNDVCEALDLKNPHQVTSRLDDDEKGVINVDTLGGTQEVAIISESGVYSLVLTSRKPEAKAFKRWVTSEVLPAIRKTGQYVSDKPVLHNPMSQLMIDSIYRIDALEQQQAETKRQADEAMALALKSITGQEWLTIRQYVFIHQLERQLPQGRAQQDYGRWLAGYCRERQIPVYERTSKEGWKDNEYWVQVIRETLDEWLRRRDSQLSLVKKGKT